MPYDTHLAHLLTSHTPLPVSFCVQELAENPTATVLLRKIHVYSFLVRRQTPASLCHLRQLQKYD